MTKLRPGSVFIQAVENLCGGGHFTLKGDDAYENIISWTGNQTRSGEYTFDPDYDPTDGTYPDLGEQLDLLYHDIENGTLTTSGDFYKTLKAVKDKFPKS